MARSAEAAPPIFPNIVKKAWGWLIENIRSSTATYISRSRRDWQTTYAERHNTARRMSEARQAEESGSTSERGRHQYLSVSLNLSIAAYHR